MNKRPLTLFLMMLLCVPIARAQMGNEDGPKNGGGQRMEEHIKKMFDQLNLSEKQKKMIAANRVKNKDAKKARMEAIRENMKAMGEELKKSDLDMPKVNGLHEQGKQLMGQMADQRF